MDLERDRRDAIRDDEGDTAREPQTVSRRKVLKATGGVAIGRGSLTARDCSEVTEETFDGTYMGQITGVPVPDSTVRIAGRADITPFGKAVFDGELCSRFVRFDEEKETGCLVIDGKTTFTFLGEAVLETVSARRRCNVSPDTQYDGGAENLAFNIVGGTGRFDGATGFASSAVNITNTLDFRGTLRGTLTRK